MRKLLSFLVILPLALLFLIAPGCRSARRPAAALRVGVIAMLTGDNAANGRHMLAAAELAVGQANATGGVRVGRRRVPVQLRVEDDGGGPVEALTAARRLIYGEEVQALIGPQFSSHAIPVARLAESAGVLMICPMSTHPDTTAGRSWVFRLPYLDTFQGEVLARFARENLGAHTAAMLYDVADAYSSTLAELFGQSFRSSGGTLIASETYTSDRNEDFTGQLTRIARSAPEVLLLPNYSADVLCQARQARESGVEAVLLGGDGWDPEPLSAQPYMEGAFCTRHFVLDPSQSLHREFAAAYRGRTGLEPEDVAATTWDAFGLLLRAVETAGRLDPEAVRRSLMGLPPYPGVTGSIDYIGNGDPLKSASIVQIGPGTVRLFSQVQPLPTGSGRGK